MLIHILSSPSVGCNVIIQVTARVAHLLDGHGFPAVRTSSRLGGYRVLQEFWAKWRITGRPEFPK